jgi:hypothetical protein
MTFEFETPQGLHIRIEVSLFTGREVVRCDGEIVSSKTSFLYLTPHSFIREEDGESIVYELNVITGFLGTRPGHILRRNGIVVAHS